MLSKHVDSAECVKCAPRMTQVVWCAGSVDCVDTGVRLKRYDWLKFKVDLKPHRNSNLGAI